MEGSLYLQTLVGCHKHTVVVLFVAVFFLLSASCAHDVSGSESQADNRLPSLSQFSDPHSAATDFQRYREAVGRVVDARSMAHRNAEQRALNLPFELKASTTVPYRGRYLLFHGLNDSAYVWQPLAAELARRGFDVRAILFDGHGSTPVDMLDVRWEWWMMSAREHLSAWTEAGVPLFVGGFSMGAVVATWLALDNPSIDGLLLISPAFESRLNHYLRWSGIYARFRPWVFGGMILEDNPMKYNSIPVNSGWQYFKLTRALKRRWGRNDRLRMPTLMIMTDDDSVVNTQYTAKLFNQRFVSRQSRMLRYANHSALGANTARSDEGYVSGEEGRTVHRSSNFPARRILNQSHLGIMYPPADTLFGEAGRVLVCNGNEYPIFMACMRAGRHWYGAQHTPSPDGVPVARTTYNADWPEMLSIMDSVLVGQLP